MKIMLSRLPTLLTLALILALLAHGPIPQWPHYHDFADTRNWHGLPDAMDVLSNAGFALVGAWGLIRLWPARRQPSLARGWPGYRLFLAALVLTAAGSSYYHLAPDDARLVWDRLPIALACAGLLAGVRGESGPAVNTRAWALLLSASAVASVAWWHYTGLHGEGDLRPYILVQGLPLVLIPLWQTIHRAPRADRLAFAAALGLYGLAKATEAYDHETMALLGLISGHTLKHLLATAAAWLLVWRLTQRVAGNRSDLQGALAASDFGYRSDNTRGQ
jgi:hypothetical protein